LKKITSFSVKDLAAFSGSIPYVNTMLEFRFSREEFLAHLEGLQFTLSSKSYTAEALEKIRRHPNFSNPTASELTLFFQAEVKRIESFRSKVTSRLHSPDRVLKWEVSYLNFMNDISKSLKRCYLALERLTVRILVSYDLDDLLVLIDSFYVKHARTLLFKTLFYEIRRFPITRRHGIIKSCLQFAELDLRQVE